jgi:AcrR family transcriptional regulator/DNA-binding MarR family transcriptional regulator
LIAGASPVRRRGLRRGGRVLLDARPERMSKARRSSTTGFSSDGRVGVVDGLAGGLSRDHVVQIQRARLLAATVRVACEDGAGNVTVARIVECAGVSRRTFYEVFTDSEECLLAALEEALQRACSRVLPVWCSDASWVERLRGCLGGLLGLFDEDPLLARLLVVESLGGGWRALELRSSVLSVLIDAVDEGRSTARAGSSQPARLAAEGAVGGVLSVLHARIADGESLTEGESECLTGLTGALMGMLVLPYQGLSGARRELSRPGPVRTGAREQASDRLSRSDPFKDAGMRLTYRTVRVLEAVAEHPGSSNRRIGDLAEMSDQGQISKLLGRLQRLGFVSNDGASEGRGGPNAWVLTVSGERVVQSIRAHTHNMSPAGAGLVSGRAGGTSGSHFSNGKGRNT